MVFKSLRSNKGFGLVEILMAVGLIGLVGFALTRVTTDLIASRKKAETLADYNLKMGELNTYFSNPRSCQNIMSSVLIGAGGVNGLMNGVNVDQLSMSGVQIAARNQVFGGVVVTGINVQVQPNVLDQVRTANRPSSIYRADVRVQVESVSQQIRSFGIKSKTFSLVMTVEDGTTNLTSCQDDSANRDTLKMACVMSNGRFDENGAVAQCDMSTNQEIVQITESTQRLQEMITNTNTSITNMQIRMREEIRNIVQQHNEDIAQTQVNIDNLRDVTLNKFSETAIEINQAYLNINDLRSEHLTMTETLAQLAAKTEQDNQQVSANINELTNVVNVNSNKVQQFNAEQNIRANTLNNTMNANDQAVQVALNTLKSQVNINEAEQVAVNNILQNEMNAQDQAHQMAMNKVVNDVNVKKTQQLAVANEMQNKMAAQDQAQQQALNALKADLNVVKANQAEVNSGLLNQIKATADSSVEIENTLIQTINVNKNTVISTVNQLSQTVNKQSNSTASMKANLSSMIDAGKAETDSKINQLNSQASTINASIAGLSNTLGSMTANLNNAINTVNSAGVNQAGINGLQGRANAVQTRINALRPVVAEGGGDGDGDGGS